ncbi:LUD domain-containing protein [Flavobacteriaceae bacterium]|nr:LUD domain-containing protein [Flavobacteriaceae bacterium]|tara:strand:+ start:4026 stop:4610 length:585 start_codon:yes stop_codon:yes gene_type:complete
MGIWNKFFGAKKPEKSPYFPDSEGPLDLGFVKKFTSFGGFFLYNDSSELVLKNFKEICTENNWNQSEIISLNQNLAQRFQVSFVEQASGKLDNFKAILIHCEFLISNTGKILLSNNQINHFKIKALPKTIIVSAKISQIARDVSQGMTQLKNKYINTIPTNITTLNIKRKSSNDKQNQEEQTDSKNIYLLLEDY